MKNTTVGTPIWKPVFQKFNQTEGGEDNTVFSSESIPVELNRKNTEKGIIVQGAMEISKVRLPRVTNVGQTISLWYNFIESCHIMFVLCHS